MACNRFPQISRLGIAAMLVAFCAGQVSAGEPSTFTTTASGLKYLITHDAPGPTPMPGQVVIYHYVGTFTDGSVFDSSRKRGVPFAFTYGKGRVIRGVEEAFQHFGVGDKGTMILPPALAYGERGSTRIPPNSTLRFDIEVLKIEDHALDEVLRDTFERAGLEGMRRKYLELKAVQFSGHYADEGDLGRLGHSFLEKSQMREAIACLEWGVELFPRSASAYDGLAEAYAKNGERQRAIDNYRRSLGFDPDNQNAKKMLAELEAL